MKKPLLQVALDHLELDSALESAALLAPHVDVLEAGTILCFAEGATVVKILRDTYPAHSIVADLKAADAGSVLAEMVFSRGATWMTVICSAPYATMATALKTARNYGGDVQVELYGEWTYEHATEWMKIGLKQAIYHQGRDAAAAGKTWGEDDIAKIRRLTEMGLEVSVTGGLKPADLWQFRGIPVKCFISGRSLYDAADPVSAALEFRAAIDQGWS